MRVLAPLLLIPIACHALATQLLTPAECRTTPPLIKFADFNKIPFPIRTPHFLLTNTNHFQLHGRDKQGRPWQVQLPDPSHGGYRSGSNYYFHGYTGGAGFAPPTWILALTFDESGRPVPFYFYTQGTIEDLVNLDGRGPHGAHNFPAFEKWSVRWKDRPAVLVQNPATKYTVKDFSNDPAKALPIRSLKYTNNGLFQPSPGTGCQTIAPLVSVIDSPTGRQISLETFDLPTLQDPKTHHILAGLHRWPGQGNCTIPVLGSQVKKIN